MPIIEKKKVSYTVFQILDEFGNCNEKLMPDLTEKQIKEMYRLMVLSRKFDEKALLMQRQGKLGTYPPVYGQEASQVGTAYLLSDDDWIFPSYRETGVLITRKLPMSMILQYWNGYEIGEKYPYKFRILPMSIPIASQIVHAVGCAWASKIKKEKNISIAYFGDGATSEGDFHEAMNFASVFKVPCIFICQNNQYAISLPRKKQTASETIAQKAIAYGIDSIQVDGNDIFAVYAVMKEAYQSVKKGDGPILIELITYRLGVHTTSDDTTVYRKAEEEEQWKKKDPLIRIKKYMENKKIWNENEEKKLLVDIDIEVRKAVDEMQKTPKPDPKDLFKYVFSEIPKHLQEQMEYIESLDFEGKNDPA